MYLEASEARKIQGPVNSSSLPRRPGCAGWQDRICATPAWRQRCHLAAPVRQYLMGKYQFSVAEDELTFILPVRRPKVGPGHRGQAHHERGRHSKL